MSTTKLAIEIMNSGYVWQDVTTDVKHINIASGLTAQRQYRSNVGKMKLTLNNQSKAYNPNNDSPDSVLIRARRRVRVKASGSSLAKALQVQITRVSAASNISGQNGFNGTITITINTNDVITFSFWARAQFDSQFNSDIVTLQPNNESQHILSTTAYTNKWKLYTFTWTATTGSTSVIAQLDNYSNVPFTGTNARVIEYKNFSLTINSGANLITNPNFTNGTTGWNFYQVTGTTTGTVIDDYWIIFNGVIDEDDPVPGASGSLETIVNCVDFTDILQNQKVSLALQKSKTADQLNALALLQLTSYQTIVLMDKPVRYYRFNDLQNSTAADLSGFGQTGTYSGAVGVDLAGNPLIGDNPTLSAGFNGTTSKMTAPTIGLNGKSITFEVWAFMWDVTTTQTLMCVLNNAAVAGQTLNINVSGGKIKVFDGSVTLTSSITVIVQRWYHLIVTMDTSGNVSLYINGALDTSGSATAFAAASATPYFAAQNAAQFANCNLQDGVIYDHILTTNDITRHFNAGSATYNMMRIPGVLQDTGKQTFPTAFDGYLQTKTSVYDVIAESIGSEYGYQWFDRDGTFRFGARDFVLKQLANTPKLTLSDGMPFTMRVVQATQSVMNEANHDYFPRQSIAGTIALGSLKTAIAIPAVLPGNVPGTVAVTLDFVDPTTARLIGSDSPITPLVATTDYTINTAADGSGTDFTSNALFSVGAIFANASQAQITLKNFSTQILYATKLQIRGTTEILTLNPVTSTQYDADSIVAYQKKSSSQSLQFSSDQAFVTDLGRYLVSRYKQPFVEIPQLSTNFEAQLNGVDLLSVEMFDVLDISDTQTQLSHLRHVVIGYDYDLTPMAGDSIGSVAFVLEAANNAGWVLGDSVLGVLGTTTRLFIG